MEDLKLVKINGHFYLKLDDEIGNRINNGNLKLWEIAPWRNDTQEFIGQNGLGWGDDVRAYLKDSEINEILKQISELTDADVFCEWNCGDTVEDCTGYKCWIK